MRRAGGWILGLLVAAAMAGGAWLGLRPILRRETLVVGITRGDRDPSSDALISGARFALDEAGGRAGGFRVKLIESGSLEFFQASVRIGINSTSVIEVFVVAPLNKYASLYPANLKLLAPLPAQGTAAATWAIESGARRIVLLIDEESERSKEIALGFSTQALALQLPVVSALGTGMERAELLDRVLGQRPDFVFYAGEEAPYARGFEIFEALRKRGYAGRLMTGEADAEVSLLAVPTRVVEGSFLISPIGLPSPGFAAAYEPATGRHAGPHAWPGYLTMKAVLQAIDRAGSSREDALRQALQELAPKPRPCALYMARGGKFCFVQDLK